MGALITSLLTADQIASALRQGLTILGSLLVAKNVFNQSEVDGVIQHIPPDVFQTVAGGVMIVIARIGSIFKHKKIDDEKKPPSLIK